MSNGIQQKKSLKQIIAEEYEKGEQDQDFSCLSWVMYKILGEVESR